jgi:hypothetical protein
MPSDLVTDLLSYLTALIPLPHASGGGGGGAPFQTSIRRSQSSGGGLLEHEVIATASVQQSRLLIRTVAAGSLCASSAHVREQSGVTRRTDWVELVTAGQ